MGEVLHRVLDEMDMSSRELVSIYYGKDVTESEAEAVAALILESHPDVEVELLPGGQAIYQYILGAE